MEEILTGLEGQRAALDRAKHHAAQGDASEMVVALFESGLLIGLAKRLEKSWPSIPREDVQDIVGETVFQVFRTVRSGIRVDGLTAWTIKVANRFAHQRCLIIRSTDPIDPEYPPSAREETTGPDEEQQFASALAQARGLLPRVEGPTVKAVLTYLLDSVAAGHEDVPTREIALALGISEGSVRTALSRGRRKLLRLLVEDGTVSPS